MRRYTKTKLDANHKQIMDHIKDCGGQAVAILDPVDLFGFYDGFGGFIEVKAGKSDAYTRKQLHWIAESGPIPVAIVKDGESAMKFLATRQGLTQAQKDRIAIFLMTREGKLWNHQQVERAING